MSLFHSRILPALVLVLLITSCGIPPQRGDTAQSPIASEWPTAGWRVSSPAEEGLDPGLLEEMDEEIRQQNINLHSLLIVRHGAIVYETYYGSYRASTQHAMYSVTKSFIGTLVGMLADQSRLDIRQPVVEALGREDFASLDEGKRAMTVEDLLTMRSGLGWVEGDPAFSRMYRSDDWVKTVMDLPMAGSPGDKFVYCTGCSHVLSAVIEEVSEIGTEAFARENLFEPLGITDYRWERDGQGIALGGWGLQITPRDMAKLGLLYLHEGQWDGQQIISSSWVRAATSRQADAEGRLDYGYQWWIYDRNSAYTALGRDGQTIWVSPELDLIVVTTAQINDHDPIFDLIDRFIVPAVSEGL